MEIVAEGILSLYLQCFGIKTFVLVEVAAHIVEVLPAVVLCGVVEGVDELGIEDPVDQIVFVAEVIVEALAVHAAFGADIADAYLGKRLAEHERLQGGSQRFFSSV